LRQPGPIIVGCRDLGTVSAELLVRADLVQDGTDNDRAGYLINRA
jgi:hypothetical protein